MADPFNIPLSTTQISDALVKTANADAQPVAGSTNMVFSGGVYQQIQDNIAPVVADVATNTADIAALEAANIKGSAFSYTLLATGDSSADATITQDTTLAGTGGTPLGSGGTVLTLPAGLCQVYLSATVTDTDGDTDDNYYMEVKVNGSQYHRSIESSPEVDLITLEFSGVFYALETLEVRVVSVSNAQSRSDLTGNMSIVTQT